VIYAYGVRDAWIHALRPFNWIGRSSTTSWNRRRQLAAFTQFISNVIFKKPLQRRDGGGRAARFTFIDDGVDALLPHHREQDGCASRQIFNSATRGTT